MVRGSGIEMNFQLCETKAADPLQKKLQSFLKGRKNKGKTKKEKQEKKIIFCHSNSYHGIIL